MVVMIKAGGYYMRIMMIIVIIIIIEWDNDDNNVSFDNDSIGHYYDGVQMGMILFLMFIY